VIKLYLDEDVHLKVATILRQKGYDVISAHEVKNWSIQDFQQLEYAISQSRAIFTFNRGDFMKLHNEYIRSGQNHYGIILSKQIPLSDTIMRLNRFLEKYTSEEIENNVFWI
jgi:predicted nuclease of predicted toxin-antitoxin system